MVVSTYRHRQLGTVMLAFTAPAVIVTAAVMARSPAAADVRLFVLGVVLAMTALTFLLLGWLTVEIADGILSVRFGVGLVRRRFAIGDVRGAMAVRNRWYYGWGIRYTPHGWLFNVSGLDAVEIELASGRRYRIGTDEPQALVAAIERARTEYASRQQAR